MMDGTRRLGSAVGLGLVLAACDPGGDGATSEGTGTTTDASSTTEASSATTDAGTNADASSGDGNGQPFDPCAGLSQDECAAAEGCMYVGALQDSASDACDVDLLFPLEMCVGVAGPLSSGNTTYYAEIDGVMRYLIAGQACAFDGIDAAPLMWTECTNAPGEPEPCHCLCGANGCPTAAPMQALEACEVESPCGDPVEHVFGEAIGDYPRCVLEALRDRSPGYYPFVMSDTLFFEQARVYSTGAELVQSVRRHQSDSCGGPLLGTWGPARECTLQPPAFFDDCLLGNMDQGQCLLGYTWFSDCQEVEPSCP